MTGTNLNKLRVEPLETNDGQYYSAHDNLTEVRARYDEIKKQRVQLERRIDGIKVATPSFRKKLANLQFSKHSTKTASGRPRAKQPASRSNSMRKRVC